MRPIVLQAEVLQRLAEAVSGQLKRECGQPVISHESIYRFITTQVTRTNDYSWRHYLPKANISAAGVAVRVALPSATSSSANCRTLCCFQTCYQAGHWEADLMLFSHYGQAALALHERKFRLTMIVRQPSTDGADVDSLCLRCTITFDNGTELLTITDFTNR